MVLLFIANSIALLPFLVLAFLYLRHVSEENTYMLLFVFLCAMFYAYLNLVLLRFMLESLFPISQFDSDHDLWRITDVFVMAGPVA